jgi:hypothetical protein
VCWQCGGTGNLRRERLGGRNEGAENTNSITRGCTGTKGGRPAVCELPDSVGGRRRPSRPSGTCGPKEGAAGQRPSESWPETSDHSYRAQRNLRAKMIVVSKDDSGSRRQTGAVPEGYSGRAALRRE